MAVTNKDPGVSQDLILRVAISRGTALLSPEMIEALQAVPDMLIASRVDEDGYRVAAIPISVRYTAASQARESDSKTCRGSCPHSKRTLGGTWV